VLPRRQDYGWLTGRFTVLFAGPWPLPHQGGTPAVRSLIAAIPRNVTIVMIEHDMDTALDLADKITVLHYGRVIVEGTRAEVVADPKTREVYLGH